jgi:hypothetical protein
MGHPVGPRCGDHYVLGENEAGFWQIRTSGVEVHDTLWTNLFGLTVFESAVCRSCGAIQSDDFVDHIVEAMGDPEEQCGPPELTCPACDAAASIHAWATTPHLGFVHFAVVFWNWPGFDSPGWRIDVPALLSEAVGRTLTWTYGRV